MTPLRLSLMRAEVTGIVAITALGITRAGVGATSVPTTVASSSSVFFNALHAEGRLTCGADYYYYTTAKSSIRSMELYMQNPVWNPPISTLQFSTFPSAKIVITGANVSECRLSAVGSTAVTGRWTCRPPATPVARTSDVAKVNAFRPYLESANLAKELLNGTLRVFSKAIPVKGAPTLLGNVEAVCAGTVPAPALCHHRTSFACSRGKLERGRVPRPVL
jgi:hypothetical protein